MNLTHVAGDMLDVQSANMNFVRQGFRKLSSDRQTELTEIINHAASRVFNYAL